MAHRQPTTRLYWADEKQVNREPASQELPARQLLVVPL